MFNENDIDQAMNHINQSVQHLSQTIDDFKDFIKKNKVKENFLLENTFNKTFQLITAQFKNANIIIEKSIQNIALYGMQRELIQVFINILNNARDELVKQNISLKFISIHAITKNDKIEITILDNAGGISPEHTDKIFESHFTTKQDDKGKVSSSLIY